jgi:uncharacterized protein YbaR (Trm112 family)
MIDAELLKILRCPETHQALTPASDEVVQSLNRAITERRLQNRAGQPVTDKIDGGLVREDRKYLYPIRGTIPVLLIDEALPLPA